MRGNWPDRRQRHAVRLDASVERADGTKVVAVVTDLSLDGCCLTGAFAIGERVTVIVPRIGRLPAEIRWAFYGRAGARFVSAIEKKSSGEGGA